MDCEKEYKSLVAKVKKAHQFAQTDSTKRVLEDILPQLRESEDERIRRTLVEYFSPEVQLDFVRGVPIKKIRDWLEKQKELPFVKDVMLGYPGLYFYDGERMHFRGPAMEEKQKEQKPADKEQDSIAFLEQHGYTIVPPHAPVSIVPSSETTFTKWSEEDEKMRYFVTEAVQYRYSDRELAKYLDPKIINEKKQLKKKLFDWLRDLRPSWKPSEELIGCLERVMAFKHPEPEDIKGCEELLEQLKKPM